MKRIIVICIILICSFINLYIVNAAQTPVLTLSNKLASVGTEAELTLTLSNNPGIHAMRIKIPYDSNKLTVTSVTNSGVFSSMEYNENDKSSVAILFTGSSNQNTTGSGSVCKIKFKVTSGLAGDRISLNLSGDASNVNEEKLTLQFTNGYIQIPNYTVKYDANGGSGVPSNQTKISGTNLTLSNVKPTRTGYDFLGWATSKTASNAQYSAGGTYSSNANATLYAVWSAKKYTVKYDVNGGTGLTLTQTKTYGEPLTLSTSKPTKSGYSFAGWSSSKNSSNVEYSAGGMYTNNADITLYAVWTSSYYTVVYDANGGSGAPGSQIKESGVDLELSNTVPIKAGNTFLGWTTSASSATVQYSSGSKYTNNNNITLFAVWDNMSQVKCSINYEGNGGTDIPESTSYSCGTVINISSIYPKKTGYKFVGWSVEQGSDMIDFLPNDEYYISEDIVLYAVWKKSVLLGDINNDGIINRNDLLRFGKYFARQNVDINKEAADVNNDGSINRNDLLRLGKYFAGWEVTLG